jgi:4-amino-4-deoxy-L-arabinose transferase-like glycosyltransferase
MNRASENQSPSPEKPAKSASLRPSGFGFRILDFAVRRPLLAIAVVLLLLLGPFLNKAVHIDDPLFVWSAEQILKHPADFYGFTVNWYGETSPMAAIDCNPPATSYIFAAVMSVCGERELALHAAMLLMAFAAAAGVFQLAKMWCDRPLLATLITIVTPAFLVSGTTLMCDVPMLAVWIWTVVLWDRALKSGSAWHYAGAAVLAGLAVLTKYSALTLLPLLPLAALLRLKKPGAWLAWLCVPVAIIAMYQLGTAQLYGHGLITAAANYASVTRFGLTGGWVDKTIIGLAYFGACLLPALPFVPWLWSKHQTLAGGALVLTAAVIITFASGIGRQFGPLFQVQMVLWVANGLHLLVLALTDLFRRRDLVAWLLGSWLGSGLIFAAGLNWTVSARSFLPVVPVVAMLMVRGLGAGSLAAMRPRMLFWPVSLAAAASLLVAMADGALANSTRAAANLVPTASPAPVSQWWFQGHCGFQFYFQKTGARPVDFSRSLLRPGEIIVMPSNNSNLASPDAADVESVATLEFPVCSWLSTVHAGTGAGFYGAGGLLPFVVGPAPAEKYFIMRVVRTLSFAAPEELNNQAWQLAASPDPKARNGAEAVLLAQRACEQTQYQRPLFIGTLAAAQAEAGQFDAAIATAQRACAVAGENGETNLLHRNQELLERYRAHKTAAE